MMQPVHCWNKALKSIHNLSMNFGNAFFLDGKKWKKSVHTTNSFHTLWSADSDSFWCFNGEIRIQWEPLWFILHRRPPGSTESRSAFGGKLLQSCDLKIHRQMHLGSGRMNPASTAGASTQSICSFGFQSLLNITGLKWRVKIHVRIKTEHESIWFGFIPRNAVRNVCCSCL